MNTTETFAESAFHACLHGIHVRTLVSHRRVWRWWIDVFRCPSCRRLERVEFVHAKQSRALPLFFRRNRLR